MLPKAGHSCHWTKRLLGDRFMGFLERLQLPHGAVILLDNVCFHHANVVKQLALSRQWTLLYTPPYSPWFNPIEGVFSVVKRAYYKGCSIDEAFAAVTQVHLAAFVDKSLLKKMRSVAPLYDATQSHKSSRLSSQSTRQSTMKIFHATQKDTNYPAGSQPADRL